MEMVVDDELMEAEQVYIESGDHQHLVKLDHQQYCEILSTTVHGTISGASIAYPRREK